MTITDHATASKLTLKVTIDAQAVYSVQSYPKIQYEDAARYPDRHQGEQTSFSGCVLQVMEDGGYMAYRISSRGRYNDVVYVAQKMEDITVPLLEDDMVTVYGIHCGNYSYTSITGATITIPLVYAERINMQ